MSGELEIKEDTLPITQLLGDPSDPRSLHSILPSCIVSGAQLIEEKHINMTDRELKELIPATLTTNMARLRESLWFHIYGAQGSNKRVVLNSVIFGVMTIAHFVNQMKHPARVAYILRPPGNYECFMREALHFAVDQIRDILEQDHMNPKTNMLDPKIADVKRRIFVDIADRVKGMPIQRTENLNVNKDLSATQSFDMTLPVSAADLDKKIAELENDMYPTKDVTPSGD